MKILIVRFRQMGDAILSSSICSTLKKSFPDAEIDYVLYEHVAPVFKENKNIDNIIILEKKVYSNIFKYIKEVYKITRKKYDIVIDVMGTPKSEWFTFMSNAKYRIGFNKRKRGFTYNYKINEMLQNDNSENKTRVDRDLSLLKPLEKEFEIKYSQDISIVVTEEEKENIKKKMIEQGINFKNPILATSVTALREWKRYPEKKMIETIKLILEKYPNIQMIFFGTKDQIPYIKSQHEQLSKDSRIFTDIETKSVREFLALLSNCDMYFGNEGGARHMAQALDIPSFTVFYPESSWRHWIPKNNGRHKGIISSDIKNSFDGMKRNEIYNLITPKYLLDGFSEIFNNTVK